MWAVTRYFKVSNSDGVWVDFLDSRNSFLNSQKQSMFFNVSLSWDEPLLAWDALAVKSTSMNYAISKSFILSVNLSKLLELKLKAVNQIDVWYSRIIWALLFGELCWIFCFVFSFCSFCSYPLNRKHNAENIRRREWTEDLCHLQISQGWNAELKL